MCSLQFLDVQSFDYVVIDFVLMIKQAAQSFLSQFLCFSCTNYERAPPPFLQCGRQRCGAKKSLLVLQAAHQGHQRMPWSTIWIFALMVVFARGCRQHFSIGYKRLFLNFIGTATLVNRRPEIRKKSAWLKMYSSNKNQTIMKLPASRLQLRSVPWKSCCYESLLSNNITPLLSNHYITVIIGTKMFILRFILQYRLYLWFHWVRIYWFVKKIQGLFRFYYSNNHSIIFANPG